MGFLSNIQSAFFALRANNKADNKAASAFNAKQAMTYQLQRQHFSHSKSEINTWRKATMSARDVLMPRRLELLRIYETVMMSDDELPVAYRNAHVDVQSAPFVILRDGVEQKKAKSLFDKTWFQDFLTTALDEEFYGYSVCEFDPSRDENGEFKKLIQFPREHYRPETGEILKYVHDNTGIPIADLQTAGFKILALGGEKNYGILEVVSRVCIQKQYTLTDWSIRNERFGMPFVWLTTDLRRTDELRKREDMMAGFASNGWGIGSDSEKLEFHEPSSAGNGHLSFLTFTDRADKQIDKLVNGQTGTSNDKAYVGAAMVHERTMGQFTKSRLRRIQNFVNDTLIPFLIENGYNKLKACKLQFSEIWDENPARQKQAAATPPNDPNAPTNPPTPIGQKKKLSSAVDLAHVYNNVCCQNHPVEGERVELSTSLSDLLEKAIKNIFTKKIKAGQLDPSVWKYNVDTIWKSVEMGFGTSYAEQSTDVIDQLRRNVNVFAAFKNHANVQDVAALLVDANGQQRPYEEFKELALQVSENYNKHWLKTEYHLAERSATMAAEWQRIQADADILPNLRYLTVLDDKVREAHRKLDDVILPINDPFWDAFYPPNGYNCRCYVEQTDAPVKELDFVPDETEVPASFRNNVGKENVIFSEAHPYFVEQASSKKSILKQLKKLEK